MSEKTRFWILLALFLLSLGLLYVLNFSLSQIIITH